MLNNLKEKETLIYWEQSHLETAIMAYEWYKKSGLVDFLEHGRFFEELAMSKKNERLGKYKT